MDVAPPQRGHLRQPAAADLTVYHTYFEPTVGILPNQIKGWKLFPCKDKITLFHPYKYEQISRSEGGKNYVQK
jgi:hypothetical protein